MKKGTKHSEETKNKIREKRIGTKWSLSDRQKILKARKGKYSKNCFKNFQIK